MPRSLKIALAILAAAVIVGLISLRSLHRHVERLATTQSSDEQARRAVVAPPISTPTDTPVQAEMFWAAGPGRLAPVEVDLRLSANPVERCRQLIQALIARPPSPDQRTLPADTELLAFYILPNGTAVADFSDALSSETPSGILSESMTVNSIVRTLAANMPMLRRLKILIHGQQVQTLAGHIDLTGFFDLNPVPAQPSTPAEGSSAPLSGETTAKLSHGAAPSARSRSQ